MNIDIPNQLNALARMVEELPATENAGERVGVSLRRAYDCPIESVWDALTAPDRVRRWFMPLSGELHVGGTFQLEGNASGEILECEPPHRMRLTWGGPASIVELQLTDEGGSTELELTHEVPIALAQSGAGALWVGPGWDGAFLGLALFVDDVTIGDPAAMAASRPVQEFARRSVYAWAAVVTDSNTATAEQVAQATSIALTQFAPDLTTPDKQTGRA